MGWRNNTDAIIEGKLYLGNIATASNSQSLHERRITHIVSVCKEPIPAHHPRSGFSVHVVPVDDKPTDDLLIHLRPACEFIHAAMVDPNAFILVHCVQGLSRSACVVAAYFMYSRRMSMTDAMIVCRQSREQIWVNPSFQEQLVLFELCQYNPGPANGVYKKWRLQLEVARRRELAQRTPSRAPSRR